MNKAYIALGSNIGDPIANVKKAIAKLSEITKLIVCSSLYLTKPWGYLDQADFINAVVAIETTLSPHQLLEELKIIENEMGRQQTIRWGPRLIDLDILLYIQVENNMQNNLQVEEEGLTIPHPRMLERAFVLAPLAEIASAYKEAYDALPQNLRDEIKQIS